MNVPVPLNKQRETVLDAVEHLTDLIGRITDPREAKQAEDKAVGLKAEMDAAGLFTAEERNAANELRIRARWRLGSLLSTLDRNRHPGPGRGHKDKTIPGRGESFMAYIRGIGLDKHRADEAQQIAALSEEKLNAALEAHRQGPDSLTLGTLLELAKPEWFKLRRKDRHQEIVRKASRHAPEATIGPFPLIYADPPWKFHMRSEEGGLGRAPDDHFSTLDDVSIKEFKVDGKFIENLAADDAGLFLWCTSSNRERAVAVMKYWDFEYKSELVWVKCTDAGLQIGTGFIFRNAHEVLIYGSRGKFPAPQKLFPSVLFAPRTEHSAKPEKARLMLEEMYPDFGAEHRLELFARGVFPGWTCRGLEAHGPIIEHEQAAE